MASLKELIAQKEALEVEIERTRATARGEALDKIRVLMEEYGLTAADIAPRPATKRPGKQGPGKGGKVAAKYRNRDTGDTWSGRGLQPKWLKAALADGRKLGDFTV